MFIYYDGEWLKKEDAKISVYDHGLLYGDGVFEGIRAYNNRVFRLREHIDRLYDSIHVLMIDIHMSKKEMEHVILETLRRNNLKDAYIRVVVTRGPGDLGLDPARCKVPSVIVITDILHLYPEHYYKDGLEIVTVSVRRNSSNALNPRIKSLNYINNILAKLEAKMAHSLEAIMLNTDGYVAEGSGDNIFMYSEDVLQTPPTYIGALKGITRDVVMELAQAQGLKVRESVFTQYELYTADECFLTGTGAEIVPVVKIDQRKIGTGKPGTVTLQLMKAFKELTQREGIEIPTEPLEIELKIK